MADRSKSGAVPRAVSTTWQRYASWCCSEGQRVCETAAFGAGGSEPCGTGSTRRRLRRGLHQPQGQTNLGQMPPCSGERVNSTCSAQDNQDKNIRASDSSFSGEAGSFKAVASHRCLAGSTTLLRLAKAAARGGCCWLGAAVPGIPASSTLAPVQDSGGSCEADERPERGFLLSHRRPPPPQPSQHTQLRLRHSRPLSVAAFIRLPQRLK